MKYNRIALCFLSSVMLAGLCSCKNDDKIAEYSEMLAAEDITISTGIDTPEDEDAAKITSTDASTNVVSGTTDKTTTLSTTISTKTTAVLSASNKMTVTYVKNTSAVNNKSSNKNNTSYNNNSGYIPAATTKKTTSKPAPTTTTTTEPVALEDIDKYIDFGSISSGDGYTFDGSTLSIFSSGTYHLSGELYGMVYVNVGNDDKVKLRLNGVGIENTGAPCIQVDNADKVIVNAVSGSSNYMKCYSTNEKNDAAIFSKDDMKIKGEGSLYVFCDNEHGISCNNDLEIEECQLTVDAEKTGINSHKSITIFSGNIETNGDNCGIRCRDYIEIDGGYIASCGGKKVGADRGGIISDTNNLCINGGTVIAVGMNQTVPYGSQNSAVFSFPSVMTKDNVIGVSVSGMTLASVQPNKKFSCALISDPGLNIGDICDIWISDIYYDNFNMTDAVTQAVLDGIV